MKAIAVARSALLNATKLFQLNGAAPNDRFGERVAVVPDHDGDGFAELAVGIPTTPQFSSRKQIQILSGATRQMLFRHGRRRPRGRDDLLLPGQSHDRR